MPELRQKELKRKDLKQKEIKQKMKQDFKRPKKRLIHAEERIRILLVDDDRTFLSKAKRFAKTHNIELITCSSAKKMISMINVPVDAAIIDFYLDDRDGTDVAATLGDKPVIMISSLPVAFVDGPESWPKSVKSFVCKDQGMTGVFNAAIRACQRRVESPKGEACFVPRRE